MALSLRDALKQQISKSEFVKEVEAKQQVKLPPKKNQDAAFTSTLTYRHKRLTIRDAARNRKQLSLIYMKMNGDTKKYIVAPYEWAYRRSKDGFRKKVLWAYDLKEGSIKSFLQKGIKSVELLDDRFEPMWDILIV